MRSSISPSMLSPRTKPVIPPNQIVFSAKLTYFIDIYSLCDSYASRYQIQGSRVKMGSQSQGCMIYLPESQFSKLSSMFIKVKATAKYGYQILQSIIGLINHGCRYFTTQDLRQKSKKLYSSRNEVIMCLHDVLKPLIAGSVREGLKHIYKASYFISLLDTLHSFAAYARSAAEAMCTAQSPFLPEVNLFTPSPRSP